VAFSLDEVAANIGIGLGGMAGAGLVLGAGPQHLGWLFIIDAATFMAFGLLLIPFARADRRAAFAAGDEHGHGADQRPDVLGTLRRDPAFTYLLVVQFTVVVCGFVALEQLPVYLRNFAGVSAGIVGLLFLTNVLANVLLQLRVTRWLEGRDRIRSLQAAMILWAAIWIVVAVSTAVLRGPAAMIIAAICAGVFAVGEGIVAVIVDPLVSALAQAPMLGRYMGLLAAAWNAGLLVGPVLCGLTMQHVHGLLWPMLAALLVTAALATTRVRTSLLPEQVLVPQS
jgi:predicted MFS family arabinose efflux permease